MIPEEEGESGFTLRACVIAVALTVFLLATSSYIALRIGALPWPIIFSVIAAGILLKILSKVSGKTNRHEINVAQAGGTIGGLLASGVVFTIPGILYLQQQGIQIAMPDPGMLALVCVTAGALGVLLSVPLRRVFIDEEKLPYPSGTAGAEVLKAEMKGGRSALYIALALTITGIFVLARDLLFPAGLTVGVLPDIGLMLTLFPMPLAIGIGYILGNRASVNSWFLGSVIGWLLIIPVLALSYGVELASGISVVQDLGMGLVLGSGIGFFSSYIIPKARRIFSPLFVWRGSPWYTRMTPIVSLIALAVLMVAGVPAFAAVIAVAGTWVMVSVAAMMTGETNIDPLEQFGIIIGLLSIGAFALMGMPLGYLPAFLVVAFVSIAAAIAGDIGHDYKSAKIVGTKARDIVKIDFLAVLVAGALAPLVLGIIVSAYGGEFFTPAMPAPQAQLVAGSIFGFANPVIFYLGFILAFLWVVAENLSKRRAPVIPMVLGIGMFLGLTLGILLAIGGAIRYFTDRRNKELYAMGLIIAAGIMGGEGIAGFSSAALVVSGVSLQVAALSLGAVFAVVLALTVICWQRRKVVE